MVVLRAMLRPFARRLMWVWVLGVLLVVDVVGVGVGFWVWAEPPSGLRTKLRPNWVNPNMTWDLGAHSVLWVLLPPVLLFVALLVLCGRRLTLLALVSAVMLLAVAGNGVASYWRDLNCECHTFETEGGLEVHRALEIRWSHGGMEVYWRRGLRTVAGSIEGHSVFFRLVSVGAHPPTYPHLQPSVFVTTVGAGICFGFETETAAGTEDTYSDVIVPCWMVATLFAVLPGVWLVRLLRRRLRKLPGNRCAKCGYDLRASPERCPECGAAVAL